MEEILSRAPDDFYPRPPRGGRRRYNEIYSLNKEFLSTPSARRATTGCTTKASILQFLSTPSARRATCEAFFLRRQLCISIHALREEGDLGIGGQLSEEEQFLSTPSARRATWVLPSVLMVGLLFLSTPSARRATFLALAFGQILTISIHALREEGDRACCRR